MLKYIGLLDMSVIDLLLCVWFATVVHAIQARL
jgi:hypothetical protein